MIGAQASNRRSKLLACPPAQGSEWQPCQAWEGEGRQRFQLQELSQCLLESSCQHVSCLATVAWRVAQWPLSSRSAGHFPLPGGECLRTSLGGATSCQVIQIHLGDRVSPVAEGAELRAGKGRVLFLVEKREHVLHELAQSVIRRLVSFGPFLY